MPPYSKTSQRGYIVALRQQGLSLAAIAARPEVPFSLNTVKRWVRRFEEEGYDGLETRHKDGRPRVTTPEQDAEVRASVLAQCKRPSNAVVRELFPDNQASMSTIYSRLRRSGLHARKPAKKPRLTLESRQRRLNFAIANRDRTVDYWRNVIFSDEKTFRSDANGSIRCWRENGTRFEDENILEKAASGHVTCGFWGCIAGDGGAIALTEIPPRMNRFGYIDVLRDTMLPAVRPLRPNGVLFMQDNAGIHTARDTLDFLRQEQVEVIDWPPYSPDLNPIENVWGMIMQEWTGREERTREALVAHVNEIWQTWANRADMVSRIVNSMPNRLQAVIDANGGHTHY